MANKSSGVASAARAVKVPVYCSCTEIRPLETLVENPRNPNKHSPQQIALLARVIAAAGWRAPIVISKRSGFIVKGHGRFQAALSVGMTEVPVDVQDYATEADEWADMIADNRLAELSEIAASELKDLLQEMDDGSFNMELTGFDESALADLMTEETPEQDEGVAITSMLEVIAECADESMQQEVYNLLTEKGFKCRLVTL